MMFQRFTAALAGVVLAACFVSAGTGAEQYLVASWGEFGAKPSQFKFPSGVAVDSESNVYVADMHNHRVQKLDSEGTLVAVWGGHGDAEGKFNYPYGIAVDATGYVYVSDRWNNRVQKFDSSGRFITKTRGGFGDGPSDFKYPYGVAVGPDSRIYVIDTLNYRIQIFDNDLRPVGRWGSEEQIGVKVYMPHDIAIDQSGNIYLSDRQNHRISKFTRDGSLIKRWGRVGEGEGTPGGQFSEPHGIGVGPNGHVYVCDRYNYRIQEFDADGNFLAQWGAYGKYPGQYDFLCALAVGRDGAVYVTDQFNHRVDKYQAERMPPLRRLQKPGDKPWAVEMETSIIKPWAERATDYGAPGVGKRP